MKIFLNHAVEDKSLVMPYYERLQALGYEPWIDRRLLPGDEWDEEIQRAFNSADVYLIFLSPRSVAKRGYVQREIYDALEKQKYNLAGDIGLIPVLLEECEVPARISSKYQYVRLPDDWHLVVKALEKAAGQRNKAIHTGRQAGPFQIYLREEVHAWEGSPGYNVSLNYPHIESSRRPRTALELNDFLVSKRSQLLLNARRAKLEQEEGRFSPWRIDPEWKPVNSMDYYIAPRTVGDSIFSIGSHESGMYAGAAHGFNWVEFDNFLVVDDGVVRLQFGDFFKDQYEAYRILTDLVREQVSQEYAERVEQAPNDGIHETVCKVIRPEPSTFERFLVEPQGISLMYPQDDAFGYAVGAFGAELSWYEMEHLLKKDGPHLAAQKATSVDW
ncbi:MAG: toll/interleukin-1 receptor domain-containing protein [Lysobacteraceae bacterium]